MKTKIKIILGCLLVSSILFSFTKDDNLFLEILKKIESFNETHQQEKVYVQLDKPYYATGDDIWIKAYVLNSATHAPSTISKILYAELISEQDSVVKRLTLPLSSGISWGDFAIPDSLAEGNYRLRAYTTWMRNFDEAFFFSKTLKIGKLSSNKILATTKYITKPNSNNVTAKVVLTDKNKAPITYTDFSYKILQAGSSNISGKARTNVNGEIDIPFDVINGFDKTNGRIELTYNQPNNKKTTKIIPINIVNNDVDVQFLPEGGNLIQNIPSKIAFKAINSTGKGVNVSLKIKDQTGELIEEVKSEHLGMGSFTINPQAGISYYAEVKLPNETIKKINLPTALPSGYSLSTNNVNSEKLTAKIILSEDLMNKGDLNLLAQQGNSIFYSAKASSSNQVINFSIPKKDIPSGILTLTLFNPQNQPIAERLVFIDNPNRLITVNQTQEIKTSKRKEKVNLVLNATNNNKPVLGSFSVAVNNISKIDMDELNESNILTSLLLTSDLSGNIENPNFYFSEKDSTSKSKLDLLLLTQGWKRFILKDVINNKSIPLTYQPDQNLTIEGFVTKNKKGISKIPVFLFASTGSSFAIDTLTDENGKFTFNNLFFTDSTSFMVKAGNDKKADYDIKILPKTIHPISINKNKTAIEVNVNDAILSYLLKNENYTNEMIRLGFITKPIELNTIEVKAEKLKITDSPNLNGPGRADAVFTADDLKNSNTLRSYLEGRVSGIRFEGDVDTAILIRNGPPQERMKVIIDGTDFTESDEALNTIPLNDIASVEVLKSIEFTFVYGTRAGVIVITSKVGTNSKVEYSKAKSISTFKPTGYNFTKQFYTPKYGTPEQEKDYRTTIYWKPNIISDKEGKFNIEYLNANEPGRYRVIIEGMDSFGNLARKSFTYEVN